EPVPRGLLERDQGGVTRHHLAEAEVSVDDGSRRRVSEDPYGRAGIRLPFPDRAGVLGDADHAVGVVTAEVRADQERRHPAGVVVGNAEGGEDARGERCEAIRDDGGHGSLLTAERAGRVRAPSRVGSVREPPGRPAGGRCPRGLSTPRAARPTASYGVAGFFAAALAALILTVFAVILPSASA